MLKGIKMKQLLELLRLHFELKFSQRDIAKMTGVSKTTVGNYIKLFEDSGLIWPLSNEYLDEVILKAKLTKQHQYIKNVEILNNKEIDFATIHHELKSHKHVTLKLLWEELKLFDEIKYSYEYFTIKYNKWLKTQPSSMKQSYKGGERVFVDYSVDKIAIYDTNDINKILYYAEIFVGVLGASNYIYLEATKSQKIADFTMSHVRMFEHFDGVPELVIIDNLKSGVKTPNKYNPVITPAYYQMLSHYGVGCMPARVYKPKDKPKAENGVLIIQRWILARLRRIKFTNLNDLNLELKQLMQVANNKKLQRYPYSRLELFNKIDKPNLKVLNKIKYVHKDYKKARVASDYHVELDKHFYSIPYNLVNLEIDIWYTANTIECYYNGKRVAMHTRSYQDMDKTTNVDHMPIKHQAYALLNKTELQKTAKEIGVSTEIVVETIFATCKYEPIACKKVNGLLKLSNRFSNIQLEEICSYAIKIGVYDYKNIQILLERKINPVIQHANVRGASYYQEVY